jgi:hypothetical protein
MLKVNGIIAKSSDVQATMILEQHGLPMSILQYSSVPHTSRCRHLHGLPQCARYQYNRATHIVPFPDKVQGSRVKNYLAATQIVDTVQAFGALKSPGTEVAS